MQEEVTGKAVAIIIDGAKITSTPLKKHSKPFWTRRKIKAQRYTGASKA